VRAALIVDDVRITTQRAHWVTLQIDKGCIVVLTKAPFLEGLKRGKAWRRAAAMRARQPDAETSADLWRAVKRGPCAPK
jgi:hypothetical protein